MAVAFSSLRRKITTLISFLTWAGDQMPLTLFLCAVCAKRAMSHVQSADSCDVMLLLTILLGIRLLIFALLLWLAIYRRRTESHSGLHIDMGRAILV